ncbi:hypothetical protein [Streptomyces himalayensis]|uniref:Uncharacterized protein n=1 Tax=Streptomyces himalayensis subsp. himalayensis TaxID=2756131 RepID=A0A7W0IBM2_9ACTN|nr:hypothetical protein [Streptomyces himalayensis]MBA2949670.1 hypothetical protein [Streptomyces himalayensis subsp. himalayensis]
MHSSCLVPRLLEGACKVIVALGAVYAALVLLLAHPDALLITYKHGGLTPLIIIFAGACADWLCLRLIRSRTRPPIVLVIGTVCAVGLLTVLWWGTRGTVEEQHITPSPPSGRFQQSQPPGNAPGTVQPPAPPSAGP